MRTYGWDAVKLSNAYTIQELVDLGELVRADSSNLNPPGSFFILNARGRKRSDAVAWAIYYKQCELRPPTCDGYSGRQTNRRR